MFRLEVKERPQQSLYQKLIQLIINKLWAPFDLYWGLQRCICDSNTAYWLVITLMNYSLIFTSCNYIRRWFTRTGVIEHFISAFQFYTGYSLRPIQS